MRKKPDVKKNVILKEALFDRVARFYDYETAELVQDIPFYLKYAKECKGQVLELACGTGRILVPQAKKGIKITGVDISEGMLSIARTKIESLSKRVQRNIQLVQADMRRFNLKKKFALIFIAFRSFQHLLTKEEQGACLDCAYKHLNRGGYFILHLFAPRHDLLTEGKRSINLGIFLDKGNDINVYRHSEVEYDLASQTLKENRYYEWNDKEGNFHRHVWSFGLAYLFRYEAELLLEKYGFRIEAVFGNFDKSPYNYYSGEQIFVARKST